MDWPKFINETFAAGVGGLIGGTLGAYYKSYWTEKGKNLATYEDIRTLLAEERGKAYEQEAGKRAATHDDIENVLRERGAVKRETETIKAQIGSDLWTQQKVWEQKREAYTKVLGIQHDLQESLIDLYNSAPSLDYGDVDPKFGRARFAKEFDRCFFEIPSALTKEMDIAEIFSGTEGAKKIMQEFTPWWHSGPRTNYEERIDFLESWRSRLLEAARIDLGVPKHQ
jgi:hypothetical protein